MHYADRVVCFLDILGFRAHISDTLDRSGLDVPVEIQRISDSIALLRELSDADDSPKPFGVEITQFSDSVVLSFDATQESGVFYALLSLLHIQIGLLEKRILCRGAVVRGKLIHTSRTLFGPALNRAYDMETRAAIYPRVILDDTILAAGIDAPARHHGPEHEERSIRGLLSRDIDGFYYVDYIARAQSELDDPSYGYAEYLGRLREVAANGITHKSPEVAMKYRWLGGKLNARLAVVKEAARKTNDDVDLAIVFESIAPVRIFDL